jgi:hypothetical protein
MLKKLKVENTVGLKLAHDHTQILPGEFKGVRFRRGHLIRKSHLPKFRDLRKKVILGALVKGNEGDIYWSNSEISKEMEPL